MSFTTIKIIPNFNTRNSIRKLSENKVYNVNKKKVCNNNNNLFLVNSL